jgi:hypothetical protein
MVKMQTLRLIKNHSRRLVAGVVVMLLCGLVGAPIIASATTLVSQSFTGDSNLPTGSIVSLQKGSTDHVNSATTSNANYILGLVINADSSQLAISSNQTNQVVIATSGLEPVLVSDINGNIAAGDPITASPISGVGMKATANVKIVGVAQDSFPNSTSRRENYTDQNHQKQSVTLGQVPLLINVSYYYRQPDKTLIPQAVQNIADSLAGKKVSALPILISVGIFIISMSVVVSIIYSMIRSSIISVGRNPMSQAAVYRNVIQLSALVVVILGVAVGAIYMILTKF